MSIEDMIFRSLHERITKLESRISELETELREVGRRLSMKLGRIDDLLEKMREVLDD